MIHVFVTSHGGMAEGTLESVEMLIGKQENLTAITFGKEMGVDELEECFQKEIVDVSEKNQYLILCDLKGGTPFNTASRFSFKNENVAVMYGMNLPLVITASLEASEEGQTLKNLYDERVGYFEKYADITIDEDGCQIEETIDNVIRAVEGEA